MDMITTYGINTRIEKIHETNEIKSMYSSANWKIEEETAKPS